MQESYLSQKFIPHVLIVSEVSSHILALIKLLIKKNCRVTVASENKNTWVGFFENEKLVRIVDAKELNRFSIDTNYLIFDFYNLLVQEEIDDFESRFNRAIKLTKESGAKAHFLFPYTLSKSNFTKVSNFINSVFTDKDFFVGLLFLGDFFSDRSSSNQYFSGRDFYYPLSGVVAAEHILRNLFSLRGYGSKIAILGKSVRASEFLTAIKMQGVESYGVNNSGFRDFSEFVNEYIYTKENLGEFLRPLLLSQDLKKNKTNFKSNLSPESKPERPKQRIKFAFGISRKLKFVGLSSFFLVLFFPIITIFAALFFTFLGKQNLISGNIEKAQGSFEKSIFLSTLATNYSYNFAKIPYMGKFYQKLSEVSDLFRSRGELEVEFAFISQKFLDLSTSIIDEKAYDLNSLSRDLSLGFMSFYSKLGFLDGETKDSSPFIKKLVGLGLGERNVSGVLNTALALGNFFKELPSLLGENAPTKYALFLQNNSILRPTGGRIDAFAILTFSGGKLVDYRVYETSEVDKNLKGHVAPPEPLKKYFGLSTWLLRDSNWDPNFEVSATKSEWFLDKELDLALDGAISVNTSFISQVLGNDVASETKSSRVLEDFLQKIFKSNPKERFVMTKKAFEAFNQKDLQFFLHNNQAQRVIASTSWDGSVQPFDCDRNCFSEAILVNEISATSGALQIRREADLFISLEEGLVKRRLSYFMENDADSEYSIYLRLSVDADSGFSPVTIIRGSEKKVVTPDVYAGSGLKDAGVFVVLDPKEALVVVFNWESASDVDLQKEGEYVVTLVKQPGVSAYPVNIQIKTPEDLNVSSYPTTTLTLAQTLGYNTFLQEDATLHLFWENE